MPVSSIRAALAGLCAACAVAMATSRAVAQDAFYNGKRLTMLINFGPGSATDIEARVFGRHFAKHIAGHPGFIMQNMDGAGGLNATLYLGEVAPKDGTTLGYITGAAWLYATDPEKYRVDLKSYEFVGYQSGTVVYFVRTDVPPGIKDATDIVKARGLVTGGIGARNGRDTTIRLTLDILGVPFRHVTGYRSGEHALLALQRNEIQFYANTTPGYRGAVAPTLVKDGTVIPLYVDPIWDGESFSVSKQVEGLPILPFHELYQKIKGTKPTGPLWEAYLACLALNGTLQRLLALPPGAPPAAVTALRDAVSRLNNDTAFAEDAMKTLGFVPEFHVGPETSRTVRNALTLKQEIKAFVANYLKEASK